MRAQFVLSEIGIGLRRNLTMTIAVVITFAVSLAMLGTALLMRAQVDAMKTFWYDKIEVSIFLCGADSEATSCSGGAVTDAQRTQIEADLRALPQVQEVFYESQQQAYERFKEQFKDTAIADNVTPDTLPESFRVKLNDPTQYDVVAGAFVGRPGVEQVQDQRKILDRLFKVLNIISYSALVVALAMVFVTALLIINTIRVSAFSRRRETGIMRLVGASNFYIQLPFVLEGVIAALAGWAFAALGAIGLKVLVDKVIAPEYPFTDFFGWSAVWQTVLITLIVGVALAGLASFFTTSRYLKV